MTDRFSNRDVNTRPIHHAGTLAMSYFINIDKLTTRLARAHVDPRLVSVGSYAEGCYCIAQNENGVWETFIGERSEKSELKVWNSEEDACMAFLGYLAWTEWHD